MVSQTAIYGLSTIIGRFLNVFLSFWLTNPYGAEDFAVFTLTYAYVTFLNVIFTYGMETSFFRFMQREEYKGEVYNTSMTSMLLTTIIFAGAMMYSAPQLANLWKIPSNPEYITWFAWIIAFDTLSAIPFARLRFEGRPIKYAVIKISSILLTVLIAYFFISVCPDIAKKNPDSILLYFYDPSIGIGYTFIANLVSSGATLLMLLPQILKVKWRINKKLWGEMLLYSWPLILVGLGGMINEVLNRILLDYRLTGTFIENKREVGIFNANLKIAALLNIVIQAFRTGAEPFFFAEADKQDARKTYARVMKLFVMIGCLTFLGISLFADTIWVPLLLGVEEHPEYGLGSGVIPIIALAYLFLGIYYNLTVWYKLTNKTIYGAYITLGGAFITILLNYLAIPYIGYWACAWVTLICYGFMMIVSYRQGQHHYRIPYAWKKLTAYVVISIMIYLLFFGIEMYVENRMALLVIGILFLLMFAVFIGKIEEKELSRLPILKRMYRSKPNVVPPPNANLGDTAKP